jgi:hypothetical protein
MLNYDKWCAYTDGLSSPKNYLDWSWLYTVSAALQRRVWSGPKHMPLFPNIFVILVGNPGVGKGLSIGACEQILRRWVIGDNKDLINKRLSLSDAQRSVVEMNQQTEQQMVEAAEFQGRTKEAEIVKPLLIPIASDAITYEALVQAMGQALRRTQYIEYTEDGKSHLRTYCHSSLCFVLKELSSLMRRRTEDTINYLLGVYDCPLDYEYRTKTQGMDRVKRGCINILAGTTPAFMQSAFDESLAGEGFNSRVFYIYGAKNRKHQHEIPELNKEQNQCLVELQEHIRKLTSLYGPIQKDNETRDWLQERWHNLCEKNLRTNKSVKLTPYYSRRNIHLEKIAMAMHFGESTDMCIPIETFKKADIFLEKEEKNMHLAIVMESDQPLAKISKKLLMILETGKKNFVEIMCEMGAMKRADLEEALSFLQETGQIITETERDEDLDKNIMMYKINEHKM